MEANRQQAGITWQCTAATKAACESAHTPSFSDSMSWGVGCQRNLAAVNCEMESGMSNLEEKPFMRELKPGEQPLHEPIAAVLYLKGAEEEFERAADVVARELRDIARREVSFVPVYDGWDLLAAARWFGSYAVTHLVLLGHGTPEAFLSPGRAGIHRWKERGQSLVSAATFAKHWAPVLASHCIISLAACLCGRSPHWYLTREYGRIVSPWGPESYRRGGQYSLAASLVQAFSRVHMPVQVRAHTAAGHCTDLAMIRAFTSDATLGNSLWSLASGSSQPPSLKQRNKWHQRIKGELARHYLLGLNDAEVLARIRRTL